MRTRQEPGVSIETMPLEEAPAAYQRMKSGEAKFRMVLTMHRRADGH